MPWSVEVKGDKHAVLNELRAKFQKFDLQSKHEENLKNGAFFFLQSNLAYQQDGLQVVIQASGSEIKIGDRVGHKIQVLIEPMP